MITIELKSGSYELPQRTPAIAKKFDEFNSIFNLGNDVKTHYKACEVIEHLLGKECLEAEFGTSDKEEISTIDSVILLKRIDDEYLAPMLEYSRQKEARAFDSDVLKELKDLGNSLEKIDKMVGLNEKSIQRFTR